jgi:Tol biopolymer transport system component
MNKTTDQALAAWLQEGPDLGPRESLERALAATRRTSQRPSWTFPERWLPMQLTMARTPSLRPLVTIVVLALLVAAIAASALLIGSTRVPPPFGPARNGALVFEQNGDLLMADSLGGTSRTLVAGPERDSYPVFSNQGDRIAFIRESSEAPAGAPPGALPGFLVMAARSDGTDVRQLASFPGGLDVMRWSPDGRTILLNYTETDPTGFQLAAVNADGSGSRIVDVGMPADYASWRPGGRLVVFRGELGDGTSAVFIADADGTNGRRLPIAGSDTVDFEGLGWSPDGKHLGFMSDGSLGGTTGWQIGIADIDAEGGLTSLRRLKFDPASGDEMLPHWSPDSSQFAFILEKDGVYQMALGKPDGSGLRMVGPKTIDRNGLRYAWAPDGQTLLIASTFGKQTWWSVDVASGQATGIEGPTIDMPAWQRLAP